MPASAPDRFNRLEICDSRLPRSDIGSLPTGRRLCRFIGLRTSATPLKSPLVQGGTLLPSNATLLSGMTRCESRMRQDGHARIENPSRPARTNRGRHLDKNAGKIQSNGSGLLFVESAYFVR